MRRLAAVATALALLLAGCSAPASGAVDPVGWWVLTSGAVGPGPEGPDRGFVYLRLVAGRVETATPCSVYSANLRGQPGGERQVGNATGNPTACPPALMTFDADYLAVLQDVTSVRTAASQLMMAGPSGALTFDAVEPVDGDLDALQWRLQAVSFGGQLRPAVDRPVAGVSSFGNDVLAGSTGCRDFQVDYVTRDAPTEAEAEAVREGGMPITILDEIVPLPPCPDALVSRQDGWLRSILRSDVVVTVAEGMLFITRGERTALYRPIPPAS